MSCLQACQSLSLHSFLMLPMQRATRLPLLLQAVASHSHSPAERAAAEEAQTAAARLVSSCDEAARDRQRTQEMAATWAALQVLHHTAV